MLTIDRCSKDIRGFDDEESESDMESLPSVEASPEHELRSRGALRGRPCINVFGLSPEGLQPEARRVGGLDGIMGATFGSFRFSR